MEYMDLGSLDSVQKKLGGTIPEPLLGKVAFCVMIQEGVDSRFSVGCIFYTQN